QLRDRRPDGDHREGGQQPHQRALRQTRPATVRQPAPPRPRRPHLPRPVRTGPLEHCANPGSAGSPISPPSPTSRTTAAKRDAPSTPAGTPPPAGNVARMATPRASDWSWLRAAAQAPEMTMELYEALPDDLAKQVEVSDGTVVVCHSPSDKHLAVQHALL